MINVKIKEVQEQSIILEIIKPVETSQYRNLSSVALVEIPLDDIAVLVRSVKERLSQNEHGADELMTKARQLREETGASLMDCKGALIANNFDFSAAVQYIKNNLNR